MRSRRRRQRSTVRLIVSGGLWTSVAQFVPAAVAVGLTPVLIRSLGLERYGIFLFSASIGALLVAFDGGIGGSAQRFFAVFAARDDRLAATRLLYTVVVVFAIGAAVTSGVLWVISPLVARALRMSPGLEAEATLLFRAQGVLIAAALVQSVIRALLAAHHRYALISVVSVIGYGVYAIVVLLSLERGYGLAGLLAASAVQQMISIVMLLPAAKQYMRLRCGLLPASELRDFLAYAGRVQIVGLTGFVNLQADALLIGAVLPITNVGLYGAGANFAAQLRSLPIGALSAVQSVLGQAFGARGRAGALTEFERLQRLWVLSVSGFAAVACGIAWFAVTAWLGADFAVSGIVAAVLLVGHSVNLLTGVLTVLLATLGFPGLLARYGLVVVAVNVALTLALVHFGPVGVVAATSAGQVLGSLYLLRAVRRQVGADVPGFFAEVPWLRVVVTLSTTVAAAILVQPYLPAGPLGLVASGGPALFGLAVYLVLTPEARRVVDLVRRKSPSDQRAVPTRPSSPVSADGNDGTRPSGP